MNEKTITFGGGSKVEQQGRVCSAMAAEIGLRQNEANSISDTGKDSFLYLEAVTI